MSALSLNRLSAEVCAAPQLSPEDLQAVAAAGFRSVINNRPDHEGGPLQPPSTLLEAQAEALGLAYAYLPVSPAVQTPEEAAALAQLLQTMPKPVLLFCRSGARSAKLFDAAQSLQARR